MASNVKDVNMFLVHGKNGLFVSVCNPENSGDIAQPADSTDKSTSDIRNRFSCKQMWSLDRPARLYSRSPNNNVAIVDDRLGLSILHLNTGCSVDSSFDTLRGVGKFRNLYTSIGCKNIKHLQWSKSGVYLSIYFNLNNYSKETGVSLEDNLHIWDISQKTIVGTFSTRRLSPEQWPIIKWVGETDIFAICGAQDVSIYVVTSSEATPIKSTRLLLSIPVHRIFSVEVFEGNIENESLGPSNQQAEALANGDLNTSQLQNDGNGTNDKSNAKEGETAHLLPKGKCISLAAYTKADISFQITGNLYITTIKDCGGQLVQDSPRNHELKSEDSAEMLWSPSGRYLLVIGQSTVDLACRRYGSSSNCLLFHANGTFIGRINGHNTHDARWSPVRDEFILMEGNMPCDITLYDASCKPLFVFPKSYRNTIKWNPLGNMVALCGFGNLAGEICFWYRKDSCDYERIVHLKEPCTVVSDWSLDSRYFITASTFPRMKVDNFLKIFNHEGDLIEHQKFEECYDVCWMGTPNVANEFVRPRIRKSAEPKAIYKPKIQPRDEDTREITDGNAFKASGGLGSPPKSGNKSFMDIMSQTPVNNRNFVSHVNSISGASSRNSSRSASKPSKKTIPLSGTRIPRDTKYRGSLFSNDHGDKNDPSVDLLDAFKNVFALSQAPAAQRPPHMEPSQQPPIMHHVNTVSYPENPHSVQDRRQNFVNRPAANDTTKAQDNAAKSLSMLMRIKNQLHCEKSKPLQQSILDEVQLLKLLLEAKNRSVNRQQVE